MSRRLGGVCERQGDGLGAVVGRVSDGLRRLQTGFARSYALSMLAGTVLVVATILAVNLW
mgnify:CR=1 FL=1